MEYIDLIHDIDWEFLNSHHVYLKLIKFNLYEMIFDLYKMTFDYDFSSSRIMYDFDNLLFDRQLTINKNSMVENITSLNDIKQSKQMLYFKILWSNKYKNFIGKEKPRKINRKKWTNF